MSRCVNARQKKKRKVFGLNREHIADILNNLYLIYPRMFEKLEDPRRMERYITKWTTYLDGLQHDDVIKGIDKYVLSDKGNYNPSVKDIVNYAREEQIKRERKEGTGKRRVVTTDEEMYNLYLKEMAKPVEKRNEWLIKQCLPSCEIMTNAEAFKKKYGKYREEFERY